MRLIGQLSFFDEEPNYLEAYAQGMAAAGASAIVALDGRYLLYQAPYDTSPAEQHHALIDACRSLDIRLHLHKPAGPWAGGEVEKRNHLMRLADEVADPGDWYLLLDGDEHVLDAPTSLLPTLNAQPHNVATLTLRKQQRLHGPSAEDTSTMERRLMRAGLRIGLVNNHYTYITEAGEVLWSAGRDELQVPAAEIPGLEVVHMTLHRPRARRNASGSYYDARNAANVEPPYVPLN